MYHAETNDIHVTVMPVYIDERSDPDEGKHFWAYRVDGYDADDSKTYIKSYERRTRILC